MSTRTAPSPLPRTDYPTDRAAVAAGYRHLADLIESEQAPIPINPQVSLFLTYGQVPVDEQPAAARDLMRALGGGKYAKDVTASGGDLILRGMCGGLPVDVWVTRDAVCERVVTGTREVHIQVPIGEDPRPVKTVMSAALPVAHGTAEQLARIAHFRALETVQPEELDAVALFLIGKTGDATEKLELWNELRDDCERLWHLITTDWDDRDLDELTDDDWMRHSFATSEQELAHRWAKTRDRLASEIEGCIDRHRIMHAERTRPARPAVA